MIWFRTTGDKRYALSDLRAAIRVLLIVTAGGLAWLAFRDHLNPALPWWRWVGELVAAWVLLVASLDRRPRGVESRWRRSARAIAALAALAAGAEAIVLIPQPGRELAAAAWTVVGLLAFALARWVPFSPQDAACLIGPASSPAQWSAWSRGVRFAIGVTSVATGAAAAYWNGTHHLAGFVLWGLSLALLVLSVWRRTAPAAMSTECPWQSQAGPPLSRDKEVLAFLLILALGLTLRVANLREIPNTINPDEGRQGRWAERMWKDGFPDAFGLGWNVFPQLSYMAEYVFVQAGSTSNENLRLSAGVIGALSLMPLFFWARRWWGNVVALLAMLTLAVNPEHINWSRIALNNIHQVLVATMMLAAFARALQLRRGIDWVWLGYATALGFHTYHAAKLFPALLAVAGLLFAIGIPGFLRSLFPGILIGTLAFILCFGPLGVTIYHRWAEFYAGTSNRIDLHYLITAYQQHDIAGVRGYVRTHVLGSLLSLISIPNVESASFDPYLGVLFLLGLGWALWHWRDPRLLVVLIWTAGILVIGGMITDYPPWKARMLGFLPAVAILPALVLGQLRAQLFRLTPKLANAIVLPLCLLCFGAAFHHSWRTMFAGQRELWPGDIMTAICRVVQDIRLPATVYMAGGEIMGEPKVASNDCMIAANPERVLVNLSADPAIVPVSPANKGSAVLLVSHLHQRALLPLIRHYYPDARYDIVRDRAGSVLLHVFTLTPEAIEQQRGLRVTYRPPLRAAAGGDGSAPPANAALPLQAAWQGQVWIPEPGAYGFRSARASSLKIDNSSVMTEQPLLLAAGWHGIEMHAAFETAADRVTLEWRIPDSPAWTMVPRASLHQHPETHGLLGRYFAEARTDSGPLPTPATPHYSRIDTLLSFDWLAEWDEQPPAPFGARPSMMEWVGTVQLAEDTSHGVAVQATVPVQVFINGQLVLATERSTAGQLVEAELPNASGPLPILVRTVRPANDDGHYWQLRLLWRGPAGEWTAFADYRPHREGTR